jgi:hypothetical protein
MLKRWIVVGIEPSPSKKLVISFASGNTKPKLNTIIASKISLDRRRVPERLRMENSFSKIQNSVMLTNGNDVPANKQTSSKSPIAIVV